MKVDIFDSGQWLTGEPRGVEVVDVGHLGVEDVEHLEHLPRPRRQAITSFTIPDRRTVRGCAGVLDQRTRPEMTTAKAAKERLARLERHACRDDPIEGPGDAGSRWIVI